MREAGGEVSDICRHKHTHTSHTHNTNTDRHIHIQSEGEKEGGEPGVKEVAETGRVSERERDRNRI